MSATILTLNGEIRSESDATAITTLQRKGWAVVQPPAYNPDVETLTWDGTALIKAPLPATSTAGIAASKGFVVNPEGFAIRMDPQARARWMELRDHLRERIAAGQITGGTTVQIRDTNGQARSLTVTRLRAVLIDAWEWLSLLRRDNPDL